MSCFDKQAYKFLKKAAKSVGDVHTAAFAGGSEVNGVAFAFRPAIENTNCRMLDVAVSYCAPEDEFKRKHGKFQALLKLSNGEVVQIPLAGHLRKHGPEITAEVLLAMFEV